MWFKSYNNSASAATGLEPNEIHLGRIPRLPMTVINECIVKRHSGKKQDQLLYLDIVRERQQRAFELVQESHLIAMSKIQRSNTKLHAILRKLPNFGVGNWVWIYNLLRIVRKYWNHRKDNGNKARTYPFDNRGHVT